MRGPFYCLSAFLTFKYKGANCYLKIKNLEDLDFSRQLFTISTSTEIISAEGKSVTTLKGEQ